ncbi:hypothetical protein BJ170DRAFT_644151 [Xylariales sp. AK1849]|nr:hypothetical protein BJ170DRAFT_644151 [Xylariales sp. AK1849]
MLRGILVTAIYRKTMTMSLSVAEDASAVTLMSTDVERIVLGMAKIHDAWSTLLQVACAMYILYGQVGVVFIAPIVLSIVCAFAAIFLSSFAGAFQAFWMAALEKRIAITSSLLGSIKGVKMLGLTRKVSETVQRLRLAEIASARKFRLMLLAVVIVSFVPVTLAPVATFGIFSAESQKEIGAALGSNRIFTTLSLLSLITLPLDLLFAYVPEILAAVACFSRIQDYLYQKPLPRTRSCTSIAPLGLSSLGSSTRDASSSSNFSGDDEKKLLDGEAIRLRKAVFGWTTEAGPVLSSIDLSIPSAKLTMIIGPIASGKSTLLKGILGETPISGGSTRLSSPSVAFCDQTPWMVNESLRANITGSALFDPNWYAAVVRACALEEDLARFPEGDQVVVGSNGLSLSGGQKQRVAIARAVYARRALSLFDDVFSGLDMETQAHVMREVFGPRGLLKAQGSTVLFVTHADHLLTHADFVVVLDSNGCIVKQGIHDAASNAGLDFVNGTESRDFDKEAAGRGDLSDAPAHRNPSSLQSSVDEKTQRLGDGAVYKYYFQTFGWPKTILFFALQTALVFSVKFPEIVLSWWGESNDNEPNMHNGKYLGIFTALEVAALVSLALTCWHVLLNLAVISGTKLHLALLHSTLRAPLSFFSFTDTGSIINRFSQDINLIDAELPFSLINFICNGLTCIAQAFMIIPASPWLLTGYPILFGGLWLLQRFYLRTSRQLRFLDLDAKSPIYTQFLETLNGLATIRAFGWQEDLITKADERLDFSQKPFYLLYSIQRWLNLVLDLIVACLAVVLIAVAVCLRNSTSVGFAGVALFNIMNLSAALKSAINSWTMLETSIGAVARVKRFAESTPNENLAHETEQPPESWPASGSITFDNVTASYRDDGERPAISGLSLKIGDGDKVGICGRSGSGKSSTLMALLRLINCEGAITVDGVDISCIPRETLRNRLTAVPQDAVLLAGSVRMNCDPHGCSTDDRIVQVLRAVQLWDVIEGKGGLDADISENLFSKGQQQIFSLAKTVLNHSRIVVMDEVSSR